jgi:RHH-type transcriptional regulator, rel operon repressor / antitoxin RelB
MLALRLPKEIEERLDALAKRTGRTKSFYARRAIVAYIEDMEDVLAAEKAIAESNGEFFTLEQVMAEAGLTQADLDAAYPPQEPTQKRPTSPIAAE